MSDRIRVTIAPGEVITQKHPSGLAGMPKISLMGGDTMLVSAEQAAELYRAGKILHPVTGQPRPPEPPPPPARIVNGANLSWGYMAAKDEGNAT